MQFEIGETVSLRLEDLVVIAVETDEVGAPWITLSTVDVAVLHLPLDSEQVHLTRKVPADGVPEPGELWGDQVGCLYAVRRSNANKNAWLVDVDQPTEVGGSWHDVHTGTTGPIFRVAERPQVGGA